MFFWIKYGWDSIWFTVGFIVTNGYKKRRAWIVKFDTPIDLHKPFYLQLYSTFHATIIDCLLTPLSSPSPASSLG